MSDDHVQSSPARVQLDLALLVVAVILVNLVVALPVLRCSILRAIVGLLFVIFIPGYAFVAALFPAAAAVDAEGSSPSTIDGLERLALSMGTSIAIVPLVGVFLNYSPWGIHVVPILVSISTLTICFVTIAYGRRRALPTEMRFTGPRWRRLIATVQDLGRTDSRTDVLLNSVLVLSVLLAVGSVGYAVAGPDSGDSFTETHLLSMNDSAVLSSTITPPHSPPAKPSRSE